MTHCTFTDYVIDVGIKKYHFIKKTCNICFVFVNHAEIFISQLMKKCKSPYLPLKTKRPANLPKGLKC